MLLPYVTNTDFKVLEEVKQFDPYFCHTCDEQYKFFATIVLFTYIIRLTKRCWLGNVFRISPKIVCVCMCACVCVHVCVSVNSTFKNVKKREICNVC